jgi:hypothetical protein
MILLFYFCLVRYSSCSSWASSSSSTSPLFGHRVSVTVLLLLLRGLRLPHLRLLLSLGISFFVIFMILIYFSSLYAFCVWIDCYWKGRLLSPSKLHLIGLLCSSHAFFL